MLEDSDSDKLLAPISFVFIALLLGIIVGSIATFAFLDDKQSIEIGGKKFIRVYDE